MTDLQTLELRSSEIRSRLAEIGAMTELVDETRAEMERLQTEYRDCESRRRALMVAGDTPPVPTEVRGDREGQEIRRLLSRANMGAMLDTIIRQRSHEGPEKELVEHYGLGGRSVPLAMLRDWEGAARALETRAAATIPVDVNDAQHES